MSEFKTYDRDRIMAALEGKGLTNRAEIATWAKTQLAEAGVLVDAIEVDFSMPGYTLFLRGGRKYKASSLRECVDRMLEDLKPPEIATYALVSDREGYLRLLWAVGREAETRQAMQQIADEFNKSIADFCVRFTTMQETKFSVVP